MSYEIIYNKQFVKLEKKNQEYFIPILLQGSNNCYEIGPSGKERRARSWSNVSYYTNRKLYATADEILKVLDLEREKLIKNNKKTLEEYPDWEKYNDSAFGYFASVSIYGKHTSNTTFKQFKNIFTLGIKQALTVEELKEYGISTSLRVYHYDNKDIEKIREFTNLPLIQTPDTSEELINLIDEYEKVFEGKKILLYISLNASEYNMKLISRDRRSKRITKEKIQKTFDKYYVVRYKDFNQYIARILKRGVRFSYSPNGGKQFLTKKEAERYKTKVEEKRLGREFIVEEINEQITRYVAV